MLKFSPLWIAVSLVNAAIIIPRDSNQAQGLSGKFIHVTDFHLDPHYLEGATIDSTCHRKGNSSEAIAGKFGTVDSNCDSPLALVDKAFDFMKSQVPDADFVIYTGDSVRHDRDPALPRTEKEAATIESTIVQKFSKSFSKVIPVIGNNDVTPHNNVSAYDIEYTFFRQIWLDSYDLDLDFDFIKGGYYVQEILPQLRTINLNTMVFSKKNMLLKDDCDVLDSPGRIQMDWLRRALEDAQSHSSKVYILAHIPPNTGGKDKSAYKRNCYTEYYNILGAYSDVILGHFTGHFNYDQLTAVLQNKASGEYTRVAAMGKEEAPVTSEALEQNKVVGVLFHGPSIIPENNPAIRVYTYDTAGTSYPVGTILDWEQYFVDLNEANRSGNLEFKLEYRASEVYGVNHFDADGLHSVFETLSLDAGVRTAYATYRSVSSKDQ